MNLFFQKSRRTLPILFVLCVTLFFSPAALLAQPKMQSGDDGLSMTVRPGFDGIVKTNTWFSVLVTLANDGPPVDGDLKVTMGDGGTVWTTAVSLPTQSRKQIVVPVFNGGLARPLAVQFDSESGETLLNYNNGPLTEIDPGDSLLHAIVSPEPDTLELLNKVLGGRTSSSVAYISLDEIPSSPVGLQGLDTLVFSDIDTNPLSAEQRSAIESWVRHGGQLVISGGASWQKTSAAFSDLMPVEVVATESVDSLSGFEADIGVDFRDEGPYVVARSSLKNGELVWRNDSLPILARRPEGAGNVWFLALDPRFAPLDDWDGSLVLWESIVQFAPRDLFWERGFADQSQLVEAVSTIPSVKLPSFWLILGFMLLYILIVGPLNYLVLSRMKKRELAWLSLPLTMLLFSVAALIIGMQFRGNQVLINQLSVVSGRIDEPNLKVESAIGVFSPRRAAYNVAVESAPNVRHVDQFGFGGFGDATRVRLGNNAILEELVVDVGDVLPFAATSYRGQSPISGQAVLVEDGTAVELTITNISGEPFQDSLLLAGGIKQVALLEIEPGETIKRTIVIPTMSHEPFAAAAAGAPESYQVQTRVPDSYQDSPLENGFGTLIEGGDPGDYYQTYGVSDNYQRYSLLSSLYDTYSGQTVYTPADRLVLIGWSDTTQLELSLVDGRYENRGSTLFFIEIPVSQ